MAKDTYEKQSAIATNIYHLEKQIAENKIHFSDLEIHRIAKWNYKKFGYGKVSLTSYLTRYEHDGRLYNTNVKLWYKLLKIIFKRDNYTCVYCGSVGGKLEGDHIIPISKGGSNDLANLTTACRKCNRQKKDKSVEEFLKWKNNA